VLRTLDALIEEGRYLSNMTGDLVTGASDSNGQVHQDAEVEEWALRCQVLLRDATGDDSEYLMEFRKHAEAGLWNALNVLSATKVLSVCREDNPKRWNAPSSALGVQATASDPEKARPLTQSLVFEFPGQLRERALSVLLALDRPSPSHDETSKRTERKGPRFVDPGQLRKIAAELQRWKLIEHTSGQWTRTPWAEALLKDRVE